MLNELNTKIASKKKFKWKSNKESYQKRNGSQITRVYILQFVYKGGRKGIKEGSNKTKYKWPDRKSNRFKAYDG